MTGSADISRSGWTGQRQSEILRKYHVDRKHSYLKWIAGNPIPEVAEDMDRMEPVDPEYPPGAEGPDNPGNAGGWSVPVYTGNEAEEIPGNRDDAEPEDEPDLAEIADQLFEESGDDEEELAGLLDRIDPALVRGLITSDYLNAYQTFFYFFRENPGELEKERLILEPASAVLYGVPFKEIDLVELIFLVRDGTPHILLSDGETVLAELSGSDAYRDAIGYVEESL